MATNAINIAKCTAERLKLRGQEKWIIDTILPAGCFHVLSGPPAIGKTTWMLQQLYEWENGRPVLGFASRPCSWAYLATEKSLLASDKRLRGLGLGDWQVEMYSVESVLPRLASGGIDTTGDVFGRIMTKLKHVDLLVLEGIQSFMPKAGKGQSQNQCELLWMASLRDTLIRNNMKTIIATTHDVKSLPQGTDVGNSRARVLGTQGFIGSIETTILIESTEKANSKCYDRKVTVMGREFADIELTYERGAGGRFVETAVDGQVIETETDKELAYLTWLAMSCPIGSKDALKKWDDLAMGAKATFHRFVDRLEREGRLEITPLGNNPKAGSRYTYKPQTIQ